MCIYSSRLNVRSSSQIIGNSHSLTTLDYRLSFFVQAGWYITVHLKNVPTVMYRMRGDQPIVLYGMLPHEQKMSVVNMVLKRTPGSAEPIPAKEKLLFQVGYRRFRASPIFSQHTNGNKHKVTFIYLNPNNCIGYGKVFNNAAAANSVTRRTQNSRPAHSCPSRHFVCQN